MLDVDAFLRYVKKQKFYDKQIVHIEEIPSKPAEFGGLDIPLHESLMHWLMDKNFRLWIHQADAINKILKGKNVVITTSTSSGKSFCYNLPVLNSILNDKNTTALYLFPRKALTQDQYTELIKILDVLELEKERVGVYDGDTSSETKRQIRQNANIIMTNPYALHLYLGFFQKLWHDFCKNIKYIILDEVHLYKGIFGTNVALLIRRLKRILEKYNVHPQWILCSATINDSKGFAEKLVGEQFYLVENDGSPSGAKRVILWDLPYDDLHNKYRSGNSESRDLFKCHLKKGIQTLLFTKSRKMAELQSSWAKRELIELADKIGIYRGGLSKRDRREIERGLKLKDLIGVCSTNALELGIDIGTLEATISSGFPRSISSFKQQIGRSGRGEEISISTLIPQANPLDFFYIHNPSVLFGPIQETLLINLNNREILKKQIRCAAYEKPITKDEYRKFGIEDAQLFSECLEDLLKETFHDSQTNKDVPYLNNHEHEFLSNEERPAMKVNIDNLSDNNYYIYIRPKNDGKSIYLTTDDEEHVYRDCHPGAIYLYKAEQYYVEEIDFEKKRVYLARTIRNYFTVSIYNTNIKRLTVKSQKNLGNEQNVRIYHGRVNVRQHFHSYNKIQFVSQEIIGSEELFMPDLEFNTEAVWLIIPNQYLEILNEKGFNSEGSLHAVEHALIHMVPIQAQIDMYDIDGMSMESDFEYNQAIIYIYDAFRDGVGIAERIYLKISDILSMAHDLIKSCTCTSKKGCPGCIIATNCVNMNDPLDKKGALALLELMIEGKTQIENNEELETSHSLEQREIINLTKPPAECPNCGKRLALRHGKFGQFFGCRGYPSCNYTYAITTPERIICPGCGNLMVSRTGKNHEFLGCSGFPQCRFSFHIFKKREVVDDEQQNEDENLNKKKKRKNLGYIWDN